MAMNANVLAFPEPRETSDSCGRVRGARAKEEGLGHGELIGDQERINLLLDVPRRALSNAPLSDVLNVAARGARHVTRSDAAFVALPHAKPHQFQLGAIDVSTEDGIVNAGAVHPSEGTLSGHVFATGRLWTGTIEGA